MGPPRAGAGVAWPEEGQRADIELTECIASAIWGPDVDCQVGGVMPLAKSTVPARGTSESPQKQLHKDKLPHNEHMRLHSEACMCVRVMMPSETLLLALVRIGDRWLGRAKHRLYHMRIRAVFASGEIF